ncbi:hypothetical protein GCM10010346_27770 [Streptomyces chryseus]|uniref:Uncharacterized protein n=1 Tax=Streptomyces chryseus TaxID=68186 RepID=A0ABQ3DLC2_9ACTN|nr:hypothetical protein GCM10010346_27770 [Streptomyces chryseus]
MLPLRGPPGARGRGALVPGAGAQRGAGAQAPGCRCGGGCAGTGMPLRGAFPDPPLPEPGLRPGPRSSNAGRAENAAGAKATHHPTPVSQTCTQGNQPPPH